jgi:hypothetical protein
MDAEKRKKLQELHDQLVGGMGKGATADLPAITPESSDMEVLSWFMAKYRSADQANGKLDKLSSQIADLIGTLKDKQLSVTVPDRVTVANIGDLRKVEVSNFPASPKVQQVEVTNQIEPKDTTPLLQRVFTKATDALADVFKSLWSSGIGIKSTKKTPVYVMPIDEKGNVIGKADLQVFGGGSSGGGKVKDTSDTFIDPATEQKQDDMIDALADVITAIEGIPTTDVSSLATQTTLAAILAILTAQNPTLTWVAVNKTGTDGDVVAAPSAGNHLEAHHIYTNNADTTDTKFYLQEGSGGVPVFPFYLASYGGGIAQNLKLPWILPTASSLYYNHISGTTPDLWIVVGYVTKPD